MFEVELEDMCEDDPRDWESLAEKRWQEYTEVQEETRDSVTGESLDPTRVKEGCEEEMGFMRKLHVWDRVPREQAKNDRE